METTNQSRNSFLLEAKLNRLFPDYKTEYSEVNKTIRLIADGLGKIDMLEIFILCERWKHKFVIFAITSDASVIVSFSEVTKE